MSLPYIDCRRCVAKGCTSKSATHQFFRFPKNRTSAERLRYAKWAEFAQNPKVTGVHNSHAYLCALHFARNQFRDDDKDRLIYRAIPTIPAPGVISEIVVTSVDPSEDYSMQLHSDGSMQSPLNAQSPEHVSLNSSEDDNYVQELEDDSVLPRVHVLYPHDSIFDQSPENSSLHSRDGTSVEPFEHGSSEQHCCPGSSSQTRRSAKLVDEGSSIASACDNLYEEIDVFDIPGCNSYKAVTPRKTRQVKVVSKKKDSSKATTLNRYKIQKKHFSLLDISSNEALVAQHFAKSVPLTTAQFLASQLLYSKKQHRGRQWTVAEKVLAIAVYKQWPECYKLLTKMCLLPSKKCLLNVLAKVSLLPGLNEHIFQSLEEAVADMDALDRTCLLLFDEIPICEHLEYDDKTDAILGFQNLGDLDKNPKFGSHTPEVGTHALIFVVKGLNMKWKQPVAFYFTAGHVPPDTLLKLLCSVIEACWKAGLNIVATVCDTSTSNTQVLKLFCASEDKPYFHFEGQKIITLYDTPHLLRFLRNILLKLDIHLKRKRGKAVESKASWSVIRAAYNVDRQQPVDRHLHKLTDNHISPRGHVAMDVAVAAQVMSRTMAATISEQVASGLLDSSALATAHFVGFCNKLFDSLNGMSVEPEGADGLRCQLCNGQDDNHLKFWDECVKEMKQWKVEVSRSVQGSRYVEYVRPPCLSGWITTLEGMKILWETLKQLGFSCMEPRSINLETLQHIFTPSQSNFGPSSNFTVAQLVSAVKASLLDSLAFVDVEQINFAEESDTDDRLNNLRTFVMCSSSAAQRELVSEDTSSVSHDVGGAYSLSCVACDVARKILLDSNCTSCEQALCAATRDPSLHCGIIFKEYSDTNDGLTYPSPELVRCVGSAIDVVEQVLPQIAHRERVKATVLSMLKARMDFEWLHLTCPVHAESIRDEILVLVCHTAILQWCKKKNSELSTAT